MSCDFIVGGFAINSASDTNLLRRWEKKNETCTRHQGPNIEAPGSIIFFKKMGLALNYSLAEALLELIAVEAPRMSIRFLHAAIFIWVCALRGSMKRLQPHRRGPVHGAPATPRKAAELRVDFMLIAGDVFDDHTLAHRGCRPGLRDTG